MLTPSSYSHSKQKELSKQEESHLDDDGHIYDEPSACFPPGNLATPHPFYKSMDNFNQKVLSALELSPPSSRGKLPALPIGRGEVQTDQTKAAFTEPEYDELGLGDKSGDKSGAQLKGPTAEYSELDIETMPPRQYGNIGVSTLPNPYEFETPPTSRAPTPKETEFDSSHLQTVPTLFTNTSPSSYQPLMLASSQQQTDLPTGPNYQPLGPPAGYAVPNVATLTRSNVPQPSLGGWNGEKGKNPFKPSPPPNGNGRVNTEESLEEYIIMHSPES